MSEKTESGARRRPHGGQAAFDGDRHEQRQGDYQAGVDLPVVGHVSYQSLGFYVGLGVAGVAGALEWPVAAAVGVGYALARRGSG